MRQQYTKPNKPIDLQKEGYLGVVSTSNYSKATHRDTYIVVNQNVDLPKKNIESEMKIEKEEKIESEKKIDEIKKEDEKENIKKMITSPLVQVFSYSVSGDGYFSYDVDGQNGLIVKESKILPKEVLSKKLKKAFKKSFKDETMIRFVEYLNSLKKK